MASQARVDVNLDDGAVVGGSRGQPGWPPIKFSGKEIFLVIRYLTFPDKPILQFKEYRRLAKSGYRTARGGQDPSDGRTRESQTAIPILKGCDVP